MPKSKVRKKRKPYTPKEKVMVAKKTPHCKVCGTDCRLATNAELANIKAHDPSFNLPFLFLPECNCWETNEDWMTL